MVERIAAVTLDMVTSVTNFSHNPVLMSVLISAMMLPALQAARNASARGETLPSNSPNTRRSIVPALRMTPGRVTDTPI